MVSDEALCDRLVAGDLSAFDALYARYERHLLGFIRAQLKDAAEAEDVLHDTFMNVLREARAGRRAESFKPWVFQVARNVSLNRLRSRRQAAVVAEPQVPANEDRHPEALLESRQTLAAVHEAVARLPEGLAELYRLRAAGLSYDELAGVLEVPLGTVKSRLHDLMKRLREEVAR